MPRTVLRITLLLWVMLGWLGLQVIPASGSRVATIYPGSDAKKDLVVFDVTLVSVDPAPEVSLIPSSINADCADFKLLLHMLPR